MFRVEGEATTELVALVSVPLLTELVSMENGVCYRHGAPNGAVRTSQRPIEPKGGAWRDVWLCGPCLGPSYGLTPFRGAGGIGK
jgi:hypothetical protein